jgi:ElaA protein
MTTADLVFCWQDFADFDAASLYAMLRFRQDIFIVEQNSAYPDLDGLDPFCKHLLVRDANGVLAAYLRARGPDGGHPAFIGRIAVAPAWRGTGLGRQVVAAGLGYLGQRHPATPVRIGAQQHLARFYGGFGFVAEGEPYDDGGIPHLTMWLRHH